MVVAAGKFKAKCLSYIDEVNQTHHELIITKHGVPKAKLVPINSEPIEHFGFMKGTAVLNGDIISTGEKWDANNE
ncbi:MAG: type II toxin-antitoxin system Phd/YefM family antitoxin [Fibrobacteres bacterium]|nr:type II toxin-antitoxin system Phd/YefM family antitoxin [Fibrobacterota bacterium]